MWKTYQKCLEETPIPQRYCYICLFAFLLGVALYLSAFFMLYILQLISYITFFISFIFHFISHILYLLSWLISSLSYIMHIIITSSFGWHFSISLDSNWLWITMTLKLGDNILRCLFIWVLHSEKLKINRIGNTILSEKICDLLIIWNLFSLLEWDPHFHYKFYFYLRMENPSQQVRNGTSISKRNAHFESVKGSEILCQTYGPECFYFCEPI